MKRIILLTFTMSFAIKAMHEQEKELNETSSLVSAYEQLSKASSPLDQVLSGFTVDMMQKVEEAKKMAEEKTDEQIKAIKDLRDDVHEFKTLFKELLTIQWIRLQGDVENRATELPRGLIQQLKNNSDSEGWESLSFSSAEQFKSLVMQMQKTEDHTK